MRLLTSNKGWHSYWFYLKNDATAPLPEFAGRLIEEAPDSWRKCGVPEKDKKRIQAHLATIRFLKLKGLKGLGIIGAYHARRVVPLLRRALPLYAMVLGTSFDGMTLAEGRSPPPKWRNTSRRQWSLLGTVREPPLILWTRCRGIPRCGWNQGTLSL